MRLAKFSWVIGGLLPFSLLAANVSSLNFYGFSNMRVKEEGRVSKFYLGASERLSVVSERAAEELFNSQLRSSLGLGMNDEIKFERRVASYEGRRAFKMRQYYNGLPVVGGEVTLQVSDRGSVRAILGSVVRGLNLDTSGAASFESIFKRTLRHMYGDNVLREASFEYNVVEGPELVIYAANGHEPVLAYRADVAVRNGGIFDYQRVFVDARTGRRITSYPLIYTGLYRKIYDGNNECLSGFNVSSVLPGTLMFEEGGSSSDQVAMAAYNNTGHTYWFYYHFLGRDSLDGNGLTLVSTVHIQFQAGFFGSCTGDNAAYLGGSYKQMVFGDGGQYFEPLAYSLDVTSHELTHGVTDHTSGLAYQNDSGAINESMSDVFGAGAEAWKQSGGSSAGNPTNFRTFQRTWLIGDDIAKPSIGDALRYMNDPARDGRSVDYYPDRNYANNCTPSQQNDYCGVHTNSGIGNLAFYLLSEGGTHPRGKTTVNVPGIGIAKALRIFYEANAQLLNQNSTYEDLRYATAQAAANQFGSNSCEWRAVHLAWDAVGVPGSWNDPGSCGGTANTPPTASFTFSTNGLTASFDASGSSDSDGSIVSYSWDFGDGSTGSGVTVSHTYAAAGTYTVTLTVQDDDGATDSQSYQVMVSDNGGGNGGGNAPCSGCDHYSGTLSGDGDYDYHPDGTYYYASAGTHQGWLEGPSSADFDLYLYKWTFVGWWAVDSSTSSSSSEHVSYDGSAGYYVWRVYSYSGSGDYDLWLDLP